MKPSSSNKKLFDLKSLNKDELIFDAILLGLVGLTSFFLNTNATNVDDTDSVYTTGFILIFVGTVISLNFGLLLNKYRIYKEFEKLFFPISMFLIISLALVATFIMKDVMVENYGIFTFIIFVLLIISYSFGHFIHVNGIVKAFTRNSLSLFIFMIVLSIIYLIAKSNRATGLNEMDYFYVLISIGIGIFLFLFLPKKIARFFIQNEEYIKYVKQVFIVLVAVAFSLWNFTAKKLSYNMDIGLYDFMLLIPLIQYRLFLSFAPPKNSRNMLITAVVLTIVLFLDFVL